MKKNVYVAPAIDFVSIETSKDILTGSWEDIRDTHNGDYGMTFPF